MRSQPIEKPPAYLRVMLVMVVFLTISCGSQLYVGTMQPSEISAMPTPFTPALDLATRGTSAVIKSTSEPTLTPSLDAAWLVEYVRSAQAITITASDSPEIQLHVDPTIREQLVKAAQSDLTPTELGSKWMTFHAPFPGYRLRVEASGDVALLSWWSAQYFSVDLGSRRDNDQVEEAYFYQANSKLYDTISSFLTPPHYVATDIRHLFHANGLAITLEPDEYSFDQDSPQVRRVVLTLVQGRLDQKSRTSQEPSAVLIFDVEGVKYQVELWADSFSYNGQTYQLADAYEKIRLVIASP